MLFTEASDDTLREVRGVCVVKVTESVNLIECQPVTKHPIISRIGAGCVEGANRFKGRPQLAELVVLVREVFHFAVCFEARSVMAKPL